MVRIFHSITLSVFASALNNEERKKGLIDLIPFETKIEEETAKGLEDDTIYIYKISLTKVSDQRKFMEFVLEKMSSEDKITLKEQIESRIDDECFFFMRFLIDPWLNEQTLQLTEEGNCIHIKALVAAYPARKEAALKTIEEYLEKLVL